MLTVRPAKVEDAAAMRELQQIAFAGEGRRSGTRDIPPLQEQVESIVQHVKEQVKPTRVDLTTNTLMQNNVPFYEKHGYKVEDRTEPIPGIVLAHMSKHLASDD
jgi:hypothetical protein